MTSSQMLLYDIVGPAALPSAVRLDATGRYLGVLVGPGVGSLIMLTLGPTRGIFLNTVFYLPLVLWLVARAVRPPLSGRPPAAEARGPRARRHRADRARGARHAGDRRDDRPGGRRVVLRSATATRRRCRASRTTSATATRARRTRCCSPPTPPARCWRGSSSRAAEASSRCARSSAILLAIGWAAALFGFALMRSYPLAIGAPLPRRLLRAFVQQHDADARADERSGREPRPGARASSTWRRPACARSAESPSASPAAS